MQVINRGEKGTMMATPTTYRLKGHQIALPLETPPLPPMFQARGMTPPIEEKEVL